MKSFNTKKAIITAVLLFLSLYIVNFFTTEEKSNLFAFREISKTVFVSIVVGVVLGFTRKREVLKQ